jgi:hypothetical protein
MIANVSRNPSPTTILTPTGRQILSRKFQDFRPRCVEVAIGARIAARSIAEGLGGVVLAGVLASLATAAVSGSPIGLAARWLFA